MAAVRLRQVVLGALILLVLGTGCNRNSQAVDADASADGARVSKGVAAQIGYTAPPFELSDIHGEKVTLAQYRGRVVLLNFWATWCGPCRIEMPALQALADDMAQYPFQVLSVAGDYEGVEKVRPFMENYRLSFPGLIDADGTVQDAYYVNALPMTYLLDRQGVVVYKLVGYFDWNQPKFRNLIQGLIDEA